MAGFVRIDELEVAVQDLKERISSQPLSRGYVRLYNNVFDGFLRFCREQRVREGSMDTADIVSLYYTTVTGQVPYENPGSPYVVRKARAVLMIRDTLQGARIQRAYRYKSVQISSLFESDIKQYSEWMAEIGNSPETIKTRIGRVKVFLLALEEMGCLSIAALTIDRFITFVSILDRKYSSAGKVNILYTLRNYFGCPPISRQLTCDPLPLLTGLHAKKHERLGSFYTPEEIRRVLASVDRSSKPGKMLYVMMLLASVYGLRSRDIRALAISGIDWKNNTITLSQHKTMRYLQLPLTDEVKFALLDYMKNARPSVQDNHVFVRLRSPHEPYSEDNHFSAKIRACFEFVGIDVQHKHAGLHSLRHSLASSLMSDDTPISEIAAILGHTSAQSTKQYIWSDIAQLRMAALEVPAHGHR